jgi:hypothetical protein
MVQVVLRESTSISPDCSAVKRSLAESGLNFTAIRIAKDGSSNAAAHVNVDTRPFTGIIRSGKAGEARGHAALDESLCLDVIQRCGGGRSGSHACNGSDANDSRQNLFVHLIQPFFSVALFWVRQRRQEPFTWLSAVSLSA